MAKRFTDTELWDKQWFMELSPKLKCLVKLVRDKSDMSGVWHPNWVLAKNYVGEKVTEAELLGVDGGRQFVKIAGGKIFCIGFVEFQYGVLSQKSPVHRKVMTILEAHDIDYKHPINRVKEKEEDKEEEEEKETVKEKAKDNPTKTETVIVPEEIPHRYVQAIRDTCINIPTLSQQLTNQEAEKLEMRYGDAVVEEVFNAMENYKDLKKKYESVYLTALNWIKRREDNKKNGTNQKTGNGSIVNTFK